MRVLLGIFITVIMFLWLNDFAIAEYEVEEILFVEWGDGESQLQIDEPYLEFHDGPDLDTVGHLAPGGGPNQVFVDRDENIYFGSYMIAYLKAFDNSGNVVVSHQHGIDYPRTEVFPNLLTKMYVDSLSRIYMSFLSLEGYVSVSDLNGNLIENLNPFETESGQPAILTKWGADDVLTFSTFTQVSLHI